MTAPVAGHELIERALSERLAAGEQFFAAEAERLARLCRRMAERFARGGRLLALGRSPAARSDARHVAVEFVHPVIVGKRALPAVALTAEGGALPAQLALLAEPDDIVIGFEPEDPDTEAALALAAERGCELVTLAPASEDARVRQEIVETAYHVLWELVHVFFEQQTVAAGPGAGAAGFLYPFLDGGSREPEAVVEDVRRSVLMKADEVGDLRAQTLRDARETLLAAAAALRTSFARRGRLLAAGNGGSATDAMDVAADLRAAGRPALDLTEDTAILTALANDIGVEALFSRQVIAHGRAGDVLLTLSTSGSSANVLAALREARRRGLVTVGYDGGRIAAERLADHVVVTRSQHIPRIQEAQATAYHVLCQLLEEKT
jgi:D-sedoheptulose 7-phosphate isomerase